jgi:hypothetical protein
MGGKYVLFNAASKTIYELDDQTKPEEFAGKDANVTGALDSFHEDDSRRREYQSRVTHSSPLKGDASRTL